jgi:Cu-Zn family superoxide dismutase
MNPKIKILLSTMPIGASLLLLHMACSPKVAPVTVELKDGSGNSMGTVQLKQLSDGVTLTFDVANLTPGKHGVHFHETGECVGPSFTTAGGHFNPLGKKHGLHSADGAHLGDLENLEVGSDGTAKVEIKATGLKLAQGENPLLVNGSAAIVIHAAEDDLATDPSGASGARIACGVIAF